MHSVSSGFLILALVTVSLVLCPGLKAANAVIVDCPIVVPVTASDSFAINIYLSNDVPLSSFSLGFEYNSEFIEATSVQALPFLHMPGSEGFAITKILPNSNQVGLAWAAYSLNHPLPITSQPGHAFTIWMHATMPDSFSCADLDSSSVPGNYIWKFDYDTGTHWLRPALIDCGACEIVGRLIQCGDADGSGRTDIGDLVYLINYIFAGGPGPLDAASGDFDCDNITRISDCVYFINYLFAGGQAPCAACK